MNLLTLDSLRHLWLVDGACDGENSDTNGTGSQLRVFLRWSGSNGPDHYVAISRHITF